MLSLGAYLALLGVILYTGRHYYGSVFRRAAGFNAPQPVESAAVLGARFFLAGIALFTILAAFIAKLDWPLALLFALGCVGMQLVLSRIVAETGLFFFQTLATPTVMIWALLGSKALGPESLLILCMFAIVMFYDPREALMPFLTNGLKLAGDYRVNLGKMTGGVMGAILLGLAVGIPVVLYFQYDKGIDLSTWQVDQAKLPFKTAIGAIQRLDAQGQLEQAGTVTGLSRFLHASPAPRFMAAFSIGAGLVILFSFLRLHSLRWPLHPVLFLVWGTYTSNCFAMSFLTGWAIKLLVTKYGGANIYQKLKPLMFGLIAGELLGGLTPIIVSLVYFLATDGAQPPPYHVMPL